jgi:ATP-dependent RNA helicase DOB1
MEHPYTFPIDPFQEKAFRAIANNENVLVTAKTGSGKTLVGEYQIYHSLKKGKRVFYTTPIKSLSNQKFHDLKKLYPSVGIMTGDIKFCPQADIVVLTTEILRNLLYKQGSTTESLGITANLSLAHVDAIVFDEVHYINDPSRGKVWEECFILLPPEIKLVLLSATIEKPEDFVEWLQDLKKVPMHLISTHHRVVPLYHKVGNELLMGPDNKFNKHVYDDYLRKLQAQEDELRKHKDAVRNRQSDEPSVLREARDHSFLHRMNEHIEMLETQTLLPALFFVFSRKMCVTYASKVTHDLVTSSETASIKHILDFHLHRYPELQTLPQYWDLSALLLKGIAYHHSGVLPLLKEIVEILFAKGFIKVLFATETFAVGINMPTKTVVFTSYRKYDDAQEGMRILRPDEYIQMAGRAGRRGKDDKGIVYYLPDHKPESTFDVLAMMTGKQMTIDSKMDFHYDFILKSLHSKNLKWQTILEQSYWYRHAKKTLDGLTKTRDGILAKKPVLEPDCEVRHQIEIELKTSQNAAKKDAQRKLETWKNKHIGPKWDTAWKDYTTWNTTLQSLEMIERELERASSITLPVEQRIETLTEMGFISNGELTDLGVMASEINEGHSLLMSRAYQDKTFHELEAIKLVSTLAQYIEGEGPSVHHQKEHLPSDPKYWTTYSQWIDPVYEWLQDGDFGELCQRYGFDAGSFIRTLLKVENILEEWITLATYCKDFSMLEKCKGLKEQLLRGIVIPDSLYLRL